MAKGVKLRSYSKGTKIKQPTSILKINRNIMVRDKIRIKIKILYHIKCF